MMRINFLLFLAFAVALIPASCRQIHQNGNPNIVVIFIDDLGYGDPGCFGNTVVKTPNIDALAAKGMKFTYFYVNSPICSPSRVALNTGCYPIRYSIHSYIAGSGQNRKRAMADFLNPRAPTLARTLQQNGYATGHFGKWHIGGGRDVGKVPLPTEYGFDKSLVSFEGTGDRVLFPNDRLSSQSAELGRGTIIWAEKCKATGIYIDSALAFITRRGNKPFYVNLFPNDVHDPHLPDLSILEEYKSLSKNPFEQKFFAVLGELDKQIGRFIRSLENMNLLENTIVIFTSDNGPTDWPRYYDPGKYPDNYAGKMHPPGSTGEFYGRKWSLYEGGIRMPFIICWKGHVPDGASDDKTILTAIDLYPSLCSLLGIACPDNLDGQDKSRAFLGDPVQDDYGLMWEYGSAPGGSILPGNPSFISPSLAIRKGEWKLLINADSTGAELFNLDEDPGGKNNRIQSMPGLGSSMASEVLSWRRTMPVAIGQDSIP